MCVCSRVRKVGYLVHERVVQEVGAPDAEVDDVNLGVDGVVEGIQEPAGVRHLQQAAPRGHRSCAGHGAAGSAGLAQDCRSHAKMQVSCRTAGLVQGTWALGPAGLVQHCRSRAGLQVSCRYAGLVQVTGDIGPAGLVQHSRS